MRPSPTGTYTLADLTAEEQRKKQPMPDPEESERAWAAIGRYQAVQRRIAEWCASGTLKSALRPYEGGDVVPLEPAVWNAELFWSRFDECRMHADDPFNTAPELRGSPAGYIFVAKAGLDRLLARARHSVAGQGAAGTERKATARQGRPRGSAKYDWATFEKEALRKLDDEGDINPALDPQWRQSALERYMSEWIDNNWDESKPSESVIRTHVVQAIKEFRRRQAE
jgi:hypothetical protein